MNEVKDDTSKPKQTHKDTNNIKEEKDILKKVKIILQKD